VLNLDISGGLPAVVIAMLVQSHQPAGADEPFVIRLLPCLPDAWPEGRLRGVRCRGGFEVDIRWKGGSLEDVAITSLHGRQCRVEYGERVAELQSGRGESCRLSSELERV